MIYIEYFSRRPEVSLKEFHDKVAQGLEWESEFGEDRLVLKAGRTWRLGPLPEYFIVWHTPEAGFERFEAWDKAFRSGKAERFEHPFLSVAQVEFAGCYEALREPVRARNGFYYAEFFRSRSERAAVAGFFEERARTHPDFMLNLLIERIGRLGPEPGGLAVWTIPNFASIASVARELERLREPVELTAAGTYTDIGQEIL
jgi:hypothetical protein